MSRTKTRFTASHHYYKMRDKYVKSKRIDAAVAVIQREEFSDYVAAAGSTTATVVRSPGVLEASLSPKGMLTRSGINVLLLSKRRF